MLWSSTYSKNDQAVRSEAGIGSLIVPESTVSSRNRSGTGARPFTIDFGDQSLLIYKKQIAFVLRPQKFYRIIIDQKTH